MIISVPQAAKRMGSNGNNKRTRKAPATTTCRSNMIIEPGGYIIEPPGFYGYWLVINPNGNEYTIQDGQCSCPRGITRKPCRHTKAVEQLVRLVPALDPEWQ